MKDLVYGSKKILDKSGERVDFKEPYFDRALRRTFKTVEEKAHFLNSHDMVSSGDYDYNTKKEAKRIEEMKHDLGDKWQEKRR